MFRRATQVFSAALALAAFTVLSSAYAQPSSGNPDSDSIMSLTGLRFTKIFSQYGTPLDIYPLRGDTSDDDGVMLD